MRISQEETVDRQTVLNVVLEEEDLEPYLNRGYRKVVQHAMIPGFRRGKAPRAIVERYVGRESLLNEVIDYMLPDVSERAIEAEDLEISGSPKIELLEMEPVTVKVTAALTPLVELGVYRDIRLDEEPVEVTQDDIEGRLQELLKESAAWDPVDRPVNLGDMVTMNVVGTVENSTILDEKDAVYVLDEESLRPFPGFSQQLKGAQASVPKEFKLKISDDHADARLAGKEALFQVTVSEVKERELPALDDEFAKGVGDGYESLAALREVIDNELNAEAQAAQSAQYREATLDELKKVVTVELPPLLIEHEVEHMVDRRDRFVDRLNVRMDDYLRYTGKTEEEIREEMQEHAIDRLTRSYALATLAETEGLDVSAEEIDERIQTLAAADEGDPESPTGQELDSEQVRSSVRETLLVGKALDRLTAIARGEAPAQNGGEQSTQEDKQDQRPEEGGHSVDSTT